MFFFNIIHQSFNKTIIILKKKYEFQICCFFRFLKLLEIVARELHYKKKIKNKHDGLDDGWGKFLRYHTDRARGVRFGFDGDRWCWARPKHWRCNTWKRLPSTRKEMRFTCRLLISHPENVAAKFFPGSGLRLSEVLRTFYFIFLFLRVILFLSIIALLFFRENRILIIAFLVISATFAKLNLVIFF